jgi:hypothetical protein
MLLLLLPGLALGPGWNLRVCVQRFLAAPACCAEENCCSDESRAPEAPVAESAGRCNTCCLDIATQHEQPVPSAETVGKQLMRAQVAACFVELVELVPPAPARVVRTPSSLPPSPPGRCTPLPLRI